MTGNLKQLKLYDDKDSDFVVHARFKDIVFPDSDIVITTCHGYLCITSISMEPDVDGDFLIDQFEMLLPYLKWFLGVKTRFALRPDNGGYPPGTMSDIIQLDPDNELYVFRGANHVNRGLMMYSLENRKRASYINPRVKQGFDLYDIYFEQCGLLEIFLKIQKEYEEGKLT